MQLKRHRRQSGFTLVEIAVSFTIVALLIGSAVIAVDAFVEQRKIEETNRRLNAAVDALIGYAIVNKRLPCPAVASATGVEAPVGGGLCTNNFSGFLPAATIGFLPIDAASYGIDSWGGQIRYAVATAGTSALVGCTGSSTLPHLTSQANLKANGISCKPGVTDLDVCITATGTNATSCNTATRAAAQSTVAFIVYSQGKNWNESTVGWAADESENNDGDPVFITRPASPRGSAQGAYDDLIVYVPIGVLYQKLIAAGVLP